MKKLLLPLFFLLLITYHLSLSPSPVHAQIPCQISASQGADGIITVRASGCSNPSTGITYSIIFHKTGVTITYSITIGNDGSAIEFINPYGLSGTYSVYLVHVGSTTPASNQVEITIVQYVDTCSNYSSVGAMCYDQCPVAGCALSAPVGGWTDCQAGEVCCKTTDTCTPTETCSDWTGSCIMGPCAGTTKRPTPSDCIAMGAGYKCCREEPTNPADPLPPLAPLPVIMQPIPRPYVSCGYTAEFHELENIKNEFSSLRPYQASPCRQAATQLSMTCANDFIGVDETDLVTVSDAVICGPENDQGYQDCQFNIPMNRKVGLTYDGAQLPIMGNTSFFPNSQQSGALDGATLVENYVSWYFNGTVNRAERQYLDVQKNCIGNSGKAGVCRAAIAGVGLCLINNPLPSVPGVPYVPYVPDLSNSVADGNGGCAGFFNKCCLPNFSSAPAVDMLDRDKLINLSGPMRKLLPWTVQAMERIKTIKKAEVLQHNQVVGCTASITYFEIPFLGIKLGINTKIPAPCYDTSDVWNTIFSDRVPYRLADWLGSKPIPLPGQWNLKIPPLEHNFPNFQSYWKAYVEWRGKICSPDVAVGPFRFYLCGDIDGNILNANSWSNLFSYIPFSSMEDRVGKVYVKPGYQSPPQGYTNQEPDSNVDPKTVLFKPEGGMGSNLRIDNLFFPHLEEDLQTAQILQTTYKPHPYSSPEFPPGAQTEAEDSGQAANEYFNSYRCELRNVRWNPGDLLFANSRGEPTRWAPQRNLNTREITGDLHFNVVFSCSVREGWLDPDCNCEEPPPSPPGTPCGRCYKTSYCSKPFKVAMSSWTQTPLIDDIWGTLVNDTDSYYRRFFPTDILESQEIMDLPGVTSAVYRGNFEKILAGEVSSNRSGSSALMFIPHLGGIQEYFLGQIQEALRPQGYAPKFLAGGGSGGEPAHPRPPGVSDQCDWDDYGCHYYDCQCMSGWDITRPPSEWRQACTSNDWKTPEDENGIRHDCTPNIGCGNGQTPLCEGGRCNYNDIKQRSDYNWCGGPWWSSDPDIECNGSGLCSRPGFPSNPEGGYGPCHFQNADACVRTDGVGGCAGICNNLCC